MAAMIYITFLEKEGPYIKVWGQTDKELPICIEKALTQMTSQFDLGQCALPPECFQPGMLCCSKFKDGNYYRAKITNTHLLSQGYVEVLFIDYGNRDFVPCGSLRNMNKFSSTLIAIPGQASQFLLAGITHVGAVWDDRIFELICSEVRYLDFEFQVIKQSGNHLLISLARGGVDICSTFIAQGYCVSTPLPVQEMMLLNMKTHSLPPQYMMMMAKPPSPPQVAYNVPPPVSPKHAMSPQCALLNYKSLPLEVDSVHPIYVSYVSDGPCLFSVQLKKMEDALKSLMTEINNMQLLALDESPLPGHVCLARSLEDEYICRAVVTSMVDGNFKVFYVDFGNTEVLPFDKLYQIPFRFVIPKVMATRFALNGLSNCVVSLTMKCEFKDFVNNKILYMRVRPPAPGSALSLCDLWDGNDVKVIDVVKGIAVRSYPDTVPLTRGFNQEVKVSFVYGCNRFYVQLKTKEEELATLMQTLQEACAAKEPPAMNTLQLGTPCNALYEGDGMFYRAQVLEIHGYNYKVRYVDYGNEEMVPGSNIRMPDVDLIMGLRPQAIECCLNGYQNMEDDQERDNTLEELILEQDFSMKVVEIQAETQKLLVDLFDGNQFNVASLLLEKIAEKTLKASPVLVQDNMKIDQRKRERTSPQQYNKRSPRENDNQDNSWRDNRRPPMEKRNDWRDRTNKNQTSYGSNEHDDRDTFNYQDKNASFESQDDQFNKRPDDRRNRDDRKPNNFRDKGDFRDKGRDNSFENRGRDNNFENRDRGDFKKRNGNFNRPTESNESSWDNFAKPNEYGTEFKRKPRNDGFGNNNFKNDYNNRNKRGNEGLGNNNYKNDYNNRNRKGDGSEKSWSGSEKSFNKFKDKGGRKPQGKFHKENSTSPSNTFGAQDAWGDSGAGGDNTPEVLDLCGPNDTYKTLDLFNTTSVVSISWFYNPNHFYCQPENTKHNFGTMMKEIQVAYKKRKTFTPALNQAVIAKFAEDNAFYRAKVLETRGSIYKVHFVDFGNISTSKSVYELERRFTELPVQAYMCSLADIKPKGEKWAKPDAFGQYFEKDSFDCTFVETDCDVYLVQLSHKGVQIGEQLVQADLAILDQGQPSSGFEIFLLQNQQFHCELSSANNLSDILLQLLPGLFVSSTLHNLQSATQTFEDNLHAYLAKRVIVYVDNVLENMLEITLYDPSGKKLQIIEPDEGAIDEVIPICAMPVFSSSVFGFVTHAASNLLYLQPSSCNEMVAMLLDALYNHYENLEAEILEPVIEDIYAVRSEDGNWYRGRVLIIENETVNVQYIDYGNEENVAISSLRKLDPLFYEPHALTLTLITENAEALINQEVAITITWDEQGWLGTVSQGPEGGVQMTEPPGKAEAAAQPTEPLVNGELTPLSATIETSIDMNLLQCQQINCELSAANSLSDMLLQLQPGVFAPCALHNLQGATKIVEDEIKTYLGKRLIAYIDNVLNNTLEITFYSPLGKKLKIIEPDEGALDEVLPVCAMPVLSSICQGYVTHAVPNLIYLQPSMYTDTIGAFLEALYTHYETLEAEVMDPVVGEIYAVRSQDGNWYRGRVLTKENDAVNVQYIDYGNEESVTANVIRTLDSSFYEPHTLSIPIIVENAETLIDQEVTVTLTWDEKGWLGSTENANLKEKDVSTPKIPEVTSEDTSEAAVTSAIDEMIMKAVPEESSEPTSHGFSVKLSHFDNPGQFYLQLIDADATISELQARLQEEISESADIENITVGIMCAAQYSLDQMWYRAQVLDADSDITTVRFIDFGNTDVLDNTMSKIKTLTPDLLALEEHAKRCSLFLKPIDNEWSGEACERFETLIDGKHLTAEVIHQDEKTSFVDLYADSVNIGTMLLEENLSSKLQVEPPTSCTGFVSNLNSPSEFWIQLESACSDLEWVADQLTSASGYTELKDLAPGALCAAVFPDDDSWYRARILSNTVAGLEVLFIDYGNSCTCSSLRELPEELVMLPPLAQKCSLQKPVGILQWPQIATATFKEISADGITIFNINRISQGETSVVQLLLEGEDISMKLLPETFDANLAEVVSLEDFTVKKIEGEAIEHCKLDLLPGHEWSGESEQLFKEICSDGATLFQVETVTGNLVRLYSEKLDIRSNLALVKSTPVSSVQSTPKKSYDFARSTISPTKISKLLAENEEEELNVAVRLTPIGGSKKTTPEDSPIVQSPTKTSDDGIGSPEKSDGAESTEGNESPKKSELTEDSPEKIDSTESELTDISPDEVGLSEGDESPKKPESTEHSPKKIGSTEVELTEISPDEVGLTEDTPKQSDEVGSTQSNPDESGSISPHDSPQKSQESGVQSDVSTSDITQNLEAELQLSEDDALGKSPESSLQMIESPTKPTDEQISSPKKGLPKSPGGSPQKSSISSPTKASPTKSLKSDGKTPDGSPKKSSIKTPQIRSPTNISPTKSTKSDGGLKKASPIKSSVSLQKTPPQSPIKSSISPGGSPRKTPLASPTKSVKSDGKQTPTGSPRKTPVQSPIKSRKSDEAMQKAISPDEIQSTAKSSEEIESENTSQSPASHEDVKLQESVVSLNEATLLEIANTRESTSLETKAERSSEESTSTPEGDSPKKPPTKDGDSPKKSENTEKPGIDAEVVLCPFLEVGVIEGNTQKCDSESPKTSSTEISPSQSLDMSDENMTRISEEVEVSETNPAVLNEEVEHNDLDKDKLQEGDGDKLKEVELPQECQLDSKKNSENDEVKVEYGKSDIEPSGIEDFVSQTQRDISVESAAVHSLEKDSAVESIKPGEDGGDKAEDVKEK